MRKGYLNKIPIVAGDANRVSTNIYYKENPDGTITLYKRINGKLQSITSGSNDGGGVDAMLQEYGFAELWNPEIGVQPTMGSEAFKAKFPIMGTIAEDLQTLDINEKKEYNFTEEDVQAYEYFLEGIVIASSLEEYYANTKVCNYPNVVGFYVPADNTLLVGFCEGPVISFTIVSSEGDRYVVTRQ